MTARQSSNHAHAGSAAQLVISVGMVALAVAMGIGRFAFTPLLPLMLRDGSLDAAAGAEWAAANYAGYLVGALTASRLAGHPVLGLRVALVGVAVCTFAVGALSGPWLPWVGALLRAAAGVFSAWALVCASSWCLAELARLGRPSLGAWVYTGVGLGIAGAGALAWLGGRQTAATLWLELGLLAAAGALLVGRQSRGAADAPAWASSAAPTSPAPRAGGDLGLVLCYGGFGFGYIVPATFLPAMAREQVPDPLVFGLAWPLFGLAAALSVAGAARWLAGWPRERVWALAQGGMALGTAMPLLAQSLWSLAASAVLVGGTFMVATMAGLQIARERAPSNPTPLLARMTVAFAVGQIAGPLLVRALAAAGFDAQDTLWWASAAASALLAASAAWLWRRPLSSSTNLQVSR
jgi:MFS family permease